jgi:hypothetical protein
MPVTITNRSNQLLILHLNDGQAVYLAPGESSRPLEDMQVSGNEKMAKLTRDNLVSIEAKKTGGTKEAAGKEHRSGRGGAASDSR